MEWTIAASLPIIIGVAVITVTIGTTTASSTTSVGTVAVTVVVTVGGCHRRLVWWDY